MATSASYFMPSPEISGTYLPVGTVDRARISFINTDNTAWFVDYSSFTPSDITITRNGGSAIDLSNGTPGQYKIGIVGSQTNQNTYYVVGLPRVALATGDYTLTVSGTVDFLETNPDFDSSIVPSISNPENIIVSAGQSVTGSLAWKQRSGTVAAWGGNTSGQTSVPVGLTNVVDVAAGGSFSLALKADGTVSAWGSGAGATALPSLSNVVAIAAGDNHALALKQDGSIVSWGTNNNSVVSNSPITGNYYSIGAGVNVSFAIGTYTGLTPSNIYGTDGTLTTWGQYTSFGEDLFVEDTPVQGLIQASAGNNFIVGVLADSTFYGSPGIDGVPTTGKPADETLQLGPFIQAIAGVNPSSTNSKFVFVLNSDNTVTGWGDFCTSGQLDGTTGGNAALLGTASVALVSSSRLEAGSLDTVSLSSASNSIQAWGYNGNPADNRVSGGSAYISTVIPSPSVGSVSAGTIQTLAQVMDLTAPTISSFVAVTTSPTSVMPLTYRLTFSKPITNTLVAADFLAVNGSGTTQNQTYFNVTAVTAVSTTIFDVTVGTLGNIPSNFSDNIYLQMVSNANTQQIRDVAGNQLSTALPSTTSTFVQFLTQAAPTALDSTSGTAFNSLQYVAPSTITFTITFSYYVSDSASGGAADPSKYTLTILTGSLTGNQIQSIVPIADGTAPANYYKQFTISVSTGTPGTNAAANFNLKLNAGSNIPVYQDPSNPITQTITSNTIRVDNLTPTITSVFPSDVSGTAITGSGLNKKGTTANTVYFTATFADVVNFAGASGLVSNYFAFTSDSAIVPANVSAFVNTVTAQATVNTPGSPPIAYSDKWVIAVSTSGSGTLGLTVKPSYTQNSTTYSIVNPVTVSPSVQLSSTLYYTIRTTTSTNTVNGPIGLTPTNTTVWDYGAINTVQRSQVKFVQVVFANPVAYTTGGVRSLTASDFKLYKYNYTNSTWESSAIPLSFVNSTPSGQSSDVTKTQYYSTFDIGFTNPDPDVTNWSIADGFYQLTVDPAKYSGIVDDIGDAFSYGDTIAQAQTMFYRLFGNSIGYDPANGYAEVTQDDVAFFRSAYNKTQPGQPNQVADFAKWSFYCYYDPSGSNGVPNQITSDDQAQMRANIGKRLIVPSPRSFP
jgi:hypothetical protein